MPSVLYQEYKDLDADLAISFPFSNLFEKLDRRSILKYENQFKFEFDREGISFSMEISIMEFGNSIKFLFLRVNDYLPMLALREKILLVWGGQGTMTKILVKF